jgi:transposase InsO family protein/transposase-like protein
VAKKRVGKFPKVFRQMAVDRLAQCDNIVALAKALGISRRLLYTWREQLEPAESRTGSSVTSRESTLRHEVSRLKRVLAEKVLEVDFSRGLAHRRGATPAERHSGCAGIYAHIRDVMSRQGQLSIERMCGLAQVSRAGLYRSLRAHQPVAEAMAVRSAIQGIAVAHRRRYGYRRITAELRRCGLLVNHKRVARLMREDNLLAVQPRAFVVTTDADHELEVSLNLASRLPLTGMNQLWVADLTYLRLKREFVYLAVMLEAYSRKVVGWALERTLAARLPIAALEYALAERHPPPGLVHHSDRGVQYASEEYVTMLRMHHMIPSMSRPANPYDNASCESFMKTLKREESYAHTYRDLDHLHANIAVFIEQSYNRVRLHSALGYHSPEEFEHAASSTIPATGATMRCFKPRARARAASSARDQVAATEAG